MESLARFVLAVTGLCEAEGRALKEQLVRLLVVAGLGLLILVLVVTGLGFLLFGLFSILAGPLTPAGAALTVGAAALLLAFGTVLYARRLLR